MSALRLRRLVLSGFGRFTAPTEFRFPREAGVWIAPNESGKSTMVAGITAVWFGLPGVSDPERFGVGRYRSFEEGSPFFGELEWEVDAVVHHLHRRFDSHRVRLWREVEGGSQVLFEGEHNPQARSSAGGAFAERLRALLGFSDVELFRETYCVMQPLPAADRLGDELQHLLTGSGAGRLDQVLERLFLELKALTRRTGDLGVLRPGATRPANQTQDGRIEQLERELGGMRLELGETTTDLDQLNRGNLAIEENDARRIGLKRSREDRAARLASLSAWVRLDEERRRRVDEEGRWAAAERELSTVDQERAALRAILGGEEERFRASGSELPTALDALVRAADEEARAGDEAARIRQERAELDQALAQAEAACRDAGEGLPTPAWDTIEWASKAFLGELDRYDQATARLTLLERHGEARAFLESENRSARLEAKLALVDARKELAGQLREAKSELLIAEERQKGSEARLHALRPTPPAKRLEFYLALLAAAAPVAYFLARREWPAPTWLAVAGAACFLLLLRALLSGRGGREREEEERRLAYIQRAGEARAHATNLENEAARIERDIASLDHQLGPFAAWTAAEFAEEAARWRQADEERARVWRERADHLHSVFALEADENPRALPGDALPTAHRALLSLVPDSNADLGEIEQILRGMDGAAWDLERGRRETERARREEALRARDELRARSAALPAEAELDARRLAAEAGVAAALRVVRAAWPEAEPDADLASWARREREAERRARELLIQESALEARRAGTLRAHSLATSTELATRRLETTAALGAVLRELEALEAKDPLLASSREERDPLVRGETLRRVMREEAQSDEAEQAEVVRLEEANRQLLREQARLEGKQGVNVARLELGARALEREIRARKQEAAALVLASSWLREAAHDYQGDHRAELEARLSRHFRHLSLSDARRVTLGSSFELALASHAGHAIAIAQLSQGARDQLFLALRLAVADLLNGPAALPFLFDDPFVHFDEERLARVKQSLAQLGQERQWLLLSHRGDLASWARAIEIRPL